MVPAFQFHDLHPSGIQQREEAVGLRTALKAYHLRAFNPNHLRLNRLAWAVTAAQPVGQGELEGRLPPGGQESNTLDLITSSF